MMTILIYWWWNVLVKRLTTGSAASDHHEFLDTSRVGFGIAQNLSSAFVEWSCFVGWPTKVRRPYFQLEPLWKLSLVISIHDMPQADSNLVRTSTFWNEVCIYNLHHWARKWYAKYSELVVAFKALARHY